MRGGYIEPRRRSPNIWGMAGWVMFLLLGAVFAWYALLGPGSTRSTDAPPAPTETTETTAAAVAPTPEPTTAPTDVPSPTPTATAAPTNTPPPLPTPLPTATQAVSLVTGDQGANVRNGPGTFYDNLGFLDPGTSAVVTGRYEKWLRIDYEGTEAWVANWVVTVSDIDSVPQVEPPAVDETVTVEPPAPSATPEEEEPSPTAAAAGPATLVAGDDGANVRSGPDTDFEQLGFLDPGDTAVITGRYERWFQIDFNGTPAWVANWVVTATGAEDVPEVEPPELPA